MDEIDWELRQAGEHWRVSQASSPSTEDVLEAVRKAPARRRIPRAALTVIVVLAIAGIAIRAFGVGQASRAVLPTDPISPVQVGDKVTGFGNVLIAPGNAPLFCSRITSAASMGAIPSCSPIAITLSGVSASDLPGRQELDSVIVAYSVIVRGTWTGDALHVESLAQALPPEATTPVLPCARPANGWTSLPPSVAAIESSTAELAKEVDAHPDLFSGTWVASGPQGDAVQVVGTIGDPETVRAELKTVYQYGLCVVPARFSARDLERVANILRRPDFTWQTQLSPALDRVLVLMPVFDGPASRAIGAYPEALARPLLYVAQ